MKKNLFLFFLSICLFNAYGQTTVNISRDTYKSSTIIYSSPNYSTYSDCNKVGVDGTQNFRGALYYSLPSSLANATITSCSLTFSIGSIIGGSNASLIISDLGTTYLPLSPSSTNWNIIASSTTIGTIPVAWNQSTVVLNTTNLKTRVQNSINNSQFFIELGVRNGYSNLLNFGAGQLTITYTVPTPPAPSNLSFSNVTTSGYTMSWSASSGATGYNIYLNGVKQTSVTSTNYTYTGLSAGTSYTVGVSAYNNNGESSKTTVNKATIPDAPANLTANIHSSSWVTLSWTSSYGASSYQVSWPGGVNSTNSTYLDVYGSIYNTYEVWAQNSSGSSAKSSITVSSLKRGTLLNQAESTKDQSESNKINIVEVKIYPNPTTDYLNISGINSYDLIVFDSQGNKILNLFNISEPVNVSHLKKGLYSVEIKHQGKIYKQKLIKE